MDWLDVSRMLIDCGIFILIWLVQLIIYPSFLYVDAQPFKMWHYRYTGLITIFVAPLMFGQLGVFGFFAVVSGTFDIWLSLVLIGIAWLATLVFSVPCHNSMQSQGYDQKVIKRLVSTNWIRTVAWSLVFIIDICVYAIRNPL